VADFRQLFAALEVRHKMYGLDDRYASLVAFVYGCDAAMDFQLLNGFRDWVATKLYGLARSSSSWDTLVAGKRAPSCLTGEMAISDIPSALDEPLSLDLLKLLDSFLAQKSSSATGPGSVSDST
jgi:hypothetical protein